MSHSITVHANHTPMLHEGGTKHYSALMISILSSTSKKSYHMVMKIHGALSKASRVNVDSFSDYSNAFSEYKRTVTAKRKRGYESKNPEGTWLLRKTFEGIEDAASLFNQEEMRRLFQTAKLTDNTKMESLSALLPGEDADEMLGAIEFVLDVSGKNADIESLFRKKNAAEAEKEAKEAAKLAVQAIEEKRSEAYGESWGSW